MAVDLVFKTSIAFGIGAWHAFERQAARCPWHRSLESPSPQGRIGATAVLELAGNPVAAMVGAFAGPIPMAR